MWVTSGKLPVNTHRTRAVPTARTPIIHRFTLAVSFPARQVRVLKSRRVLLQAGLHFLRSHGGCALTGGWGSQTPCEQGYLKFGPALAVRLQYESVLHEELAHP